MDPRPEGERDRDELGLEAALTRFADREEFDAHHELALRAFWGHLDEEDDRVQEVMALEQSQVGYLTWFVFDLVLDEGGTVADVFLAREGARLRPGEREYLARMRSGRSPRS